MATRSNYDIETISPVLTGNTLVEAIANSVFERKAIIDGFLYENTCLMIAADPGCGKSTVALQAAVEMAAGLPVFGLLNVERPVKVLYSQQERHLMETLERLKMLKEHLPLLKENLFITDEYQKFNLLKDGHAEAMARCIKRDCPGVEVAIFDPIYSMVVGGLKDDVGASMFNRGMNLIEKELGVATILVHHTIKQQYSSGGKIIEKDDPFYGSQWLKAKVTGSYYMKRKDKGVILLRKKDNYDVLLKEVVLDYDSETTLCQSTDYHKLSALARMEAFLSTQKSMDKWFDFNEIKGGTQLCTRAIRNVLVHTTIKRRLIEKIGNKNKKFYKVV